MSHSEYVDFNKSFTLPTGAIHGSGIEMKPDLPGVTKHYRHNGKLFSIMRHGKDFTIYEHDTVTGKVVTKKSQHKNIQIAINTSHEEQDVVIK